MSYLQNYVDNFQIINKLKNLLRQKIFDKANNFIEN